MRIAVLGDLLYDCFIWADRLPRVGETVTGTRNGFYCGGKGGNQAIQAARLGAEVSMIGKVGSDYQGNMLIDNLIKEGVSTEYVTQEGTTGTCCVHIDNSGNNAIIVAPLANTTITSDEIKRAKFLIENSDIFLFQLQVNEEAVTEALKIAYEAGVTTVFNPAPVREIPADYYKMINYIIPNETEAENLSGYLREDTLIELWYKNIIDFFQHKGVSEIIVTLGSSGCLYANFEQTIIFPSYDVKSVDSTAAGDAFNSTFSVFLSEGCSPIEAIQYANAAGAISVSKYGSLDSLSNRQELENFVKNNQLIEGIKL